MFKKLMCLLLCILAFGVTVAQAADWDRAAWYDSRYPTNWCDAASALNVRNGVAAAGYPILDSDQLKTWMDGHIADGELSVVIFCMDIPPDTVAESMAATCTLRQYLNAGGKIVFPADIPFYNVGHADGSTTNWADAGAGAILGFQTADAPRDSFNTVTFTAAGINWGLTVPWASQRPASLATIAAQNLTVLATDNAGNAAAWAKHYVTGDNYRGFVYMYDTTGQPNVGDMIRLAEFIPFAASNPDPADGSNVGPEYYPPNVYMVLDYTPGLGAVTHTAYFSDVEQDVIDRDPDHSLGSVPPWPTVTVTGFVVGYDDPGIPEYARAPLVPGKTYYWCIDEDDGAETHYGKVWSFTVMPEQAWGPYPEDGDTVVPSDVTATWKLGDLVIAGKTLTYNVYIGTDETAVENVATGDTVSPLYAGTASTETIDLAGFDPETEHFWRVDTSLAISRPPFTKTFTKGDVWSFTTGPRGIGGILREWWIGMSGTAIADLTNDPNYPANPDGSEIVNIFEGPTNWQDDAHPYGSRLHGWLYVETTGDYTFWIATDDNGEFWISTDMSPANASLVSQCTVWAPERAFDDPDVIPSGPIHLEGGNMYYVMGLMKEQGGGDNIAVAWLGPDSGGVREVIPGNHLIPYSPVMADNPNPPHLSVDAPLNVTLTWSGGEDQATGLPYATQRVYVGSDPAAVAAATTSSPEYKGTVSVDQYGPLSLSYYQQVYWRIDGVNGDGVVNFQGAVWTFKATYNPANIVDTNLRLWLKFEDNALDSSGYGRHGTEVGGPIYVDGQDGRAIRLDGIDDYVNVEDHVGISGAAPRTIAGWGKATTTAIGAWTDLFGFTGPSGNGGHFDIEIVGGTDSTTAGWFGLHMYGDEYDIIPADIEWHHFAATFDGANAALYADGVSVNVVAPGITINTPGNVHVGKRDDNANYFPGSIDDVRIYDVVKTEAEIAEIMRINLAWAWNPVPTHGAINVPHDQDLSWNHGDGMSTSTVYFGADDASNMVQVAGPQASTTYDPGQLDLGTAYFWQISENSMAPGRLWKFSTSDYLVVDDMEAYMPWTDPFGPWVFVSWKDGFGDCTAGNGNGTGAVLTEDATVFLTGLQSMKYDFDNDGMVYSPCTLGQVSVPYLYSRIEAQVAGLPSGIGSDWTAGGVKALSINFMGQVGNSTTEPFWVQLQDGSGYGEKVFYGDYAGEDMADFNEPTWHEWDIDLADFDVDLTNVVSCVIGIGTEGSASPGGSGTIWIDDIRLYVPRCVPSRSSAAFAMVDLNSDCAINYGDIDVMFGEWLVARDQILAPGDFIIAIDADGDSGSPDAEQVHEAIDLITSGGGQKYLNQGGANSGFIVTPSSGPSVVTSFVIWTANDTVGRDPATWTLYGTNAPIVSANHSTGTDESWTEIASGSVSLPDARNVRGPLVSFANGTSYTSYKMLFPTLKGGEPLMQIAEIQFRGGVPINFKDYAELLKMWLETEEWPN